MTSTCNNCDCAPARAVFFSALCPNTCGVTVIEALRYVTLSTVCQFTPLKSKPLEKQILCRSCAGLLGKLYNASKSFRDISHAASYINRKFEQPVVYFPSPRRNVQPKLPSTPLSSKIRKGQRTIRGRKIFANASKLSCDKEMKCFVQNTSLIAPVSNVDDVPSLEVIQDELKLYAPSVLACIKGICGIRREKDLSPQGFAAVCILANARNQLCNKFQKFMALVLMRSKATQEVFQTFNDYGISVCRRTMESVLDVLRADYNKKVLDYKKNVEDYVVSGTYRTSVDEPAAKKKLKFSDVDEFHSAALVFDNLNKSINPRDMCSSISSQQLNIVSALCVFSRIPLPLSSVLKFAPATKAQNAPESPFFLTEADVNNIKSEQIVLIQRCISDHMEMFKKLRFDQTVRRIPNNHSNLSSQKSECVNLGLLLHDENKTDGMIKIIEELQEYCPIISDDVRMNMVAWGDGLTANRLESSSRHRSVSFHEKDQLRSLVPGIGHWHKRCLLFTDDMKTLLKDQQLSVSPGTLPFLRSKLKYTQASVDVKNKFNETFRFFSLVWQSYVVALACEFLELKNETETPGCYKEMTSEQLKDVLENVSVKIQSFSWHNIQTAAWQDKYCICESTFNSEDAVVKWIACDNRECMRKKWYHTRCITFEGVAGSDDESNLDDSDNDELTQKSVKLAFSKRKKWYCSNTCRKTLLDKKLIYSKAVIFVGLMNEGLKDAVRENDGERLISHTKFNMIQFYNKRHHVYTKITVNMLYNISCHPSYVIRNDLQWNSTVNIVGERSKNIEMDLYNEFVNKVVKDFCCSGRGVTEKSLSRRSQAIGILNEIASNIKNELANETNSYSGSKPKKWMTDVASCVNIIRQENLLSYCGKRHHTGFENFNLNYVYISDKSRYTEKLFNIRSDIDAVTECAEESLQEANQMT